MRSHTLFLDHAARPLKALCIAWFDLVKRMRRLGFEGPYQAGAHPYIVKGDRVVTIPNPHREEIGVDLLKRILKRLFRETCG